MFNKCTSVSGEARCYLQDRRLRIELIRTLLPWKDFQATAHGQMEVRLAVKSARTIFRCSGQAVKQRNTRLGIKLRHRSAAERNRIGRSWEVLAPRYPAISFLRSALAQPPDRPRLMWRTRLVPCHTCEPNRGHITPNSRRALAFRRDRGPRDSLFSVELLLLEPRALGSVHSFWRSRALRRRRLPILQENHAIPESLSRHPR